ncbi:S-layer homology domain-containing protein [Paenibacillus ginsengarvi]|uniref:Uncharacterized protein n=1 Tax=Paenibacillus ginsengarvi TaxID=400777 RepID=A0A3B0CDT5_9BACL|nr:S-layer homology domain-containing protein [Paenibacillus ginsengarvi]RKN81977.1 hypothetical protein D7M11_18540 [Paenibacillus ginsengarvi]
MVPELNGEKVHAAGAYIIDTVAGSGTGGFSGDEGPATSAQLMNPYGVAVDRSGNLYIADYQNNRIRKVDVSGTIHTVAGTGSAGFSGDGGDATSAKLNYPMGVAVDNSGNLYIADTVNGRIRKVDASGTISTVAGTGVFGFSGDGGSAISAQLSYPSGIAADNDGNVYFVDQSNYRIRKVDVSGTIRTVAGTGGAGDSGDGGSATSAELRNPTSVAVDDSGNLYIADLIDNRIRKVDTAGIIGTVAGTGDNGYSGDGGAATSARLYYPAGVSVDRYGQLYIADTGNYRIRKVDASGIISTIAGTGDNGYSGDGGAATSAQLANAFGIAAGGDGDLYIADVFNQRIRKLSIHAQNVAAFADSTTPGVGMEDTITLTVKNAQGNTDISFNGTHDVTVSGYLQAPDNSYGSLNGTALSASPNTIGVMFNNGVATVNVSLHRAGTQTIHISVADVVSPVADALIITPVAGSAASMALTTDMKAPASNGGAFAQQPVVTLFDAYGNQSVGDNNTVVTVKKKVSEAWNLTGTTTATASSGSVTFTDLGATNGAVVTGAQLRFEADGLPPIDSNTVTLPWEALEVTIRRMGDLPIGTNIRDSREWGYFTAGPIEAGLSDAVVYKTAPINWILIDQDKYERGTSLFVSEEIVAETQEVVTEREVPWNRSPIRQWLRESFYPAFSSQFRNAISLTSYEGLSGGDSLQEDTFFIFAALELIPVYGKDQYVIPYFKDANHRAASGSESQYHWTRSQNGIFGYLPYLVNNVNGEVVLKSGSLKLGIRPAVNLKSDTLVEGPFNDTANGNAYYRLVHVPYQAVAELESSEVTAGSPVNVLFEVHDADGSLNTSFNEPAEVTLEGYAAAPDGTSGFFAGEKLDGTPKTFQVHFSNGVSKVPLVLHAAVQQALHFQVQGLTEPSLEAIIVHPQSGDGKKLQLQRDISRFDQRTGLFDPQPILWLVDDFGNVSLHSSAPVTVSKNDSGNWELTGTNMKQAEHGKVVFENLGANYYTEITGAQLTFAAAGPGSGGVTTSEAITLPRPVFVDPFAGNFDKNPPNQADVTTTIKMKDNTILSIKNGSEELATGEEYTIVDNVLTIKKEYLALQATGLLTLTIHFSLSTPETLDIPIMDTALHEQDTEAPKWPDGSKLMASDITKTSIKLSWPSATDNVRVLGYRIYVNDTEHKTVSSSVYATTVDGLNADSTYLFKVTAYDEAGNESKLGLRMKAATLPQPPDPDTEAPQWPDSSELIVSDITQTSVKLSWPSATDNVRVIGYRIYVNDTEHKTVSGSVYATIVDGLNADSIYTIKVTAYDAAGNESAAGLSKTATTSRYPSGGNDDTGGNSGGSWYLSHNASLKTLEIWMAGQRASLIPSFSANVYSYTIETEAKRVEVKMTADHIASKVLWRGRVLEDGIEIELEEGENVIQLIVQAEDGTRKTYTFTINRVMPNSEQPEPPVISFTDIAGHWAESDIKRAAAKGIVSGYPDGAFKPNDPVTRGEFTVMLANALELEGQDAHLPFTDQDQIGAWAKMAIARAVHSGIVNGYADGSFRSAEPITRTEMAVMIARALRLQHHVQAPTGFADDEEIPQWAKGAIQSIRVLGIVDGRSQNRFEPNEKAMRVEAAVMLLRMLGQQKVE